MATANLQTSKQFAIFFYNIIALFTISIGCILSIFGDPDLWDKQSIFGNRHQWTGQNENSHSGLSQIEYCETKHWGEFIVERSNTFSSLAFVLFGELICVIYARDLYHSYSETQHNKPINALHAFPIWSLLYGMTMIFVGTGSFLFHASLTHKMHAFDVIGIYVMIMCVCCFLAIHIVFIIATQFVEPDDYRLRLINFCFCIMLCFLNWYITEKHSLFKSYYMVGYSAVMLFGITLIGFVLMFKWFKGRHLRTSFLLFVLSIVCIAVAFVIRVLIVPPNVICHPDSPLQNHAIFHIIFACGLTSAYFCGRTIELVPIRKHEAGIHAQIDPEVTELIDRQQRRQDDAIRIPV